MSTIKKLAVLSMLVVAIIAFNTPASAAIGAGIGAGIGTSVGTAAGISTASSFSATSAGIGIGGIGGLGTFGGFGFPFNWGFSQFGIGGFPFNWGLGAGFGTFGLGWNQFSPCFGAGSFFSPCFLGSTCQYLPFISGQELTCPLGPGFGITPWAFGLGGCTRSMPLFFGAHGFGFPFTLGGFGASLIPPVPSLPAVLPAVLPAATCQYLPFISGQELTCPLGPGFGITPWAFGLGGCTRSMPLFFGAHGFGFPFTLGGFGASLIPPCAPPVPACLPACLPAASVCAYLPFISGQELLCPLGPGFGITPWAFGLGGCTRSMPLFFGAHGFGFPFTLGGFGASLIPPVC